MRRSTQSTRRPAPSFTHTVLIIVVRVALALLTLTAGAGLVHMQGTDETVSVAAPAPAAPAPAEVQVPEHGGLFNPGATLSTAQIDDLREDPYGACLMQEGVLTPAGICVDAVAIWRDEVSLDVWGALDDEGYAVEAFDPDTRYVPAEYVILGGPGGEDLLAVDMTRPLTPRPLG
jgi:hypothetical protein